MANKKFLLADDDIDDADLFCEAVHEIPVPVECHTVENGREVLEGLSTGKLPRPDVIFLDINMPVMNGWECLKRLKHDSSSRDIPVVMYSTSSAPQDIDRANTLGALLFVTKPEEFGDLREILGIIALHANGTLRERLAAYRQVKFSRGGAK